MGGEQETMDHGLDGPRWPARSGSTRSIVVMLHGYGANGARWQAQVDAWRAVLPDTLFLAPNAPSALPDSEGRYQWRTLPAPPGVDGLASVRGNAACVDALIDAELAQHGLCADRVVIVGFSQGAMMAMHVAPRRAHEVAGLLGYSGNLAAPELLEPEMRTRPTTLLVHGDADPLMPVQATLDAAAALRAAGVAVQTEIVPGVAHAIDDRGTALGAGFLLRVLG